MPDRLAGRPDRADRPNRRRHRHFVETAGLYPHLDLCRAAKGWVDDESHWRDETRAVEDRLSDALHARLTQRFVDRRTSVLMRRLKQKESLVAEVNDKGEVTVEGEFVGRLEGFRFRQDASAIADEAQDPGAGGLRGAEARIQPARRPLLQRARYRDRLHRAGRPDVGQHAVGKLVTGAERAEARRSRPSSMTKPAPKWPRRSAAACSTSSTARSPRSSSRCSRWAATRR